MNQIAGLPTHPLLVHIPVVLIPVLALAVLAFVLRPAWRSGLSVPLAACAVLTLTATLLAANAGEWLQRHVNNTTLVRRHAQQGGQLKVIAALFCLAILGTVVLDVVDRYPLIGVRIPWSRQVLALACVATIVLGLAATVWDVRAGHSGAQAVWSETPNTMLHPEDHPPGRGEGTPGVAVASSPDVTLV